MMVRRPEEMTHDLEMNFNKIAPFGHQVRILLVIVILMISTILLVIVIGITTMWDYYYYYYYHCAHVGNHIWSGPAYMRTSAVPSLHPAVHMAALRHLS